MVLMPRLRKHRHPVTIRLKPSAYQRHAERWMIGVGISSHQNYIHEIPSERLHFLPAGRQKMGPYTFHDNGPLFMTADGNICNFNGFLDSISKKLIRYLYILKSKERCLTWHEDKAK